MVKKSLTHGIFLLCGLILLSGSCTNQQPEAAPIPSHTLTPSLPPSPIPSLTSSATALPPTLTATDTPLPTETATPTHTPVPTETPTSTPTPLVPNFTQVIIIALENREFGFVIGNEQMPNYNRWANQYTLLTQYYAITHPSLSNYLAMIGGSTFGVDYSCYDCYQNAYTLVDLIEDSGRTWKTYQEDMPRPCFDGNEYKNYTKRHNPFVYFDSIRLDPERCERSVVPFEQLAVDLAAGALPDFVFIMPNQCHNAHDCPLNEADAWLGEWAPFLLAYPDFVQGGLIVLTWDEGQGNHACCGMTVGGGRVATVLMSPLVKPGFQDETPYTHYSLLKTISEAWGLPYLGHAADPEHALITLPWLR